VFSTAKDLKLFYTQLINEVQSHSSMKIIEIKNMFNLPIITEDDKYAYKDIKLILLRLVTVIINQLCKYLIKKVM